MLEAIKTTLKAIQALLNKCVKKVNGVTPDADGNVTVQWDGIGNKPFDAYYEVIKWNGVTDNRFTVPLDEVGLTGAYFVHVSDKTFTAKELDYAKLGVSVSQETRIYASRREDVSSLGMGTAVAYLVGSLYVIACVYESDTAPVGTYFLAWPDAGYYISSLKVVRGERLDGYFVGPTGLGFVFDLTNENYSTLNNTATISSISYDPLYEAICEGKSATLMVYNSLPRNGRVYINVLSAYLAGDGLHVWGYEGNAVPAGTGKSALNLCTYLFTNGSYH